MNRTTKFSIKVASEVDLRLRQPEDADDFFKVVDTNRIYLRQWLPWLDANRASTNTLKYIRKCQIQFADTGTPDLGIWYFGKWVGSIGFHHWDKVNRKSSIGYWLAESFQNKGIMTWSVHALVQYGFANMNLNRIDIRCATGNFPSQRVAYRSGFKHECVMRESEYLYDHFVDLIVFSKLRGEWRGF